MSARRLVIVESPPDEWIEVWPLQTPEEIPVDYLVTRAEWDLNGTERRILAWSVPCIDCGGWVPSYVEPRTCAACRRAAGKAALR